MSLTFARSSRDKRSMIPIVPRSLLTQVRLAVCFDLVERDSATDQAQRRRVPRQRYRDWALRCCATIHTIGHRPLPGFATHAGHGRAGGAVSVETERLAVDRNGVARFGHLPTLGIRREARV